MDLAVMAAAAGEQTGVIWTLRESSDLNANLVRFEAGGGVGEHINDEVDVIFVGVSGTGSVRTNGEERRLSENAGARKLGRKFHHREFAAHVIHGSRFPKTLADTPDDIEIRQRRFHQDDVSAFLDIEGDFA